MPNVRYFELDGQIMRVSPRGGVPEAYRAEADKWSRYDHVLRFIHEAIDINEQEARELIDGMRRRELVGAL